MFDFGFSEILVIFILALIVLGPEKMPRAVREVGRWVGRARAMARQFQEQLEEEIDVDRGRTIRPEPVRPVGGVSPEDPAPPTSGHAEAATSAAALPETGAATTASDAPASSDERPLEPLTPGTHERGI